jgi:carbon monoxide dehydrogenase subunit G
MRIENSFDVPISVDRAWGLFTDVERIVPCMPGAELTEVVDDDTYKGRAHVKLGPIKLSFEGIACFEEQDEAQHKVRIRLTGRDAGGRGTAQAIITSELAGHNGFTRVNVTTDLQLSGAVAQYGRQGIVEDVSSQLVGQFSECLRTTLAEGERASENKAPRAATEIKGFSMLLRVIKERLVRFVRGLFGRNRAS